MAANSGGASRAGFIKRTWQSLRQPSARWSVLALLSAGVAAGFAATVGTQVMVEVSGTDAFCGNACHSMQWVAQEHRQSAHGATRTGVRAGCHDCHIPKEYPALLWVKAKKGTKDIIGEIRGVISTEEKFKKERLHMAQVVWAEFKADNSHNCRSCHQFTPEVLAKQKEFARPMHQQVIEGKATCIECHKGIGHAAPSE
jgi:nitrate/TMAO reductase-like tetraheme cytochrome c subunit